MAYALSKGLGSAVVRNRLRRQLRAVFEERAGSVGAGSVGAGDAGAGSVGVESAATGDTSAGFFPAGDYLVGLWPSPAAKGTTATERKRIHNWSYVELSKYVERALGKLERKTERNEAGRGEAGRGEAGRGDLGRARPGRGSGE